VSRERYVNLQVILRALVAVAGQVEIRAARPPIDGRWPAWLGPLLTAPVRLALTLAAFAAVIIGLLGNDLAPDDRPYVVEVPLWAPVTYLAGAAVMRLVRGVPVRKPSPAHVPRTAAAGPGLVEP
jgi:hypothetical protein